MARAALVGSGGRPLARGALDRALEARPGMAEALALRARLRSEDGEHEAALVDYRAAADAEGTPAARVPYHLAAAALAQDHLQAGGPARHHLEAVLQDDPEHREALARLATLHEAEGRPQVAADALRRLLTLTGLPPDQSASHHLGLARLEAQAGDQTTALAHAARALELVPGHAEALRLMVELERRRDDPRALAVAAARRRPSARPAPEGQYPLWFLLGALLTLALLSSAVRAFRRAAALRADEAAGFERLRALRSRLGLDT